MTKAAVIRDRLWQALDTWCRGLAGNLHPVGDGLASLTPLPKSGEVAYDAVAGDQFAAAAAGYWLARTKPEETLAGPLRDLIRFALVSHVAAQDRPLSDGAVWGATAKHRSNDWHASLFTAATGLLLDGALTGQEEEQLRRAVEWEADFHARHPPGMENRPPIRGRKWPARNPAQSCGESLAWTTALLQVARIRYPDAPGAARWREAAVAHALNAMSFLEDLLNNREVAGRALSSWVAGANFEPGGIQEHHGFYHPGYMAWPLASHAVAFLLDEQLPDGERNPDVFLHHWRDVFERLKQSCLDNGRLIYAAGFDWNQYGYGNTRLLPAALFAAGRFEDALAARIADGYLGLMEFQQERTGWAFQAERMATQRKLFPNRYAWYEAIDGMTLAESFWILDRLQTRVADRPFPEPASAETFFLQTRGTYVEPGARLAWLRTDKVFASFSGRAYPGGIQALVQPLEKPHLLKWNAAGSGVLEIEGALPLASLQHCTVRPFEDGGFFAIAELTHGQWADRRNTQLSSEGTAIGPRALFVVPPEGGSCGASEDPPNIRPLVRQWIVVVALPDGTVFWFDRCRAEQACVIETNLALPVRLAADIFNGECVRIEFDGEERAIGQHPDRDTWHSLDGRALVFDGSLAIQNLEGEGRFYLLQKRRRDREGKTMLYGEGPAACEESLVSHDLWFGCRRRRPAAEGEWIRRVSHVLTCGSIAVPAIELEGEPLAFSLRCGDGVRLSIQLSERTCRLL